MYIAYHQVAKQDLPTILKSGIKVNNSGAKTDDFNAKTDTFIDSCRPQDFADSSIFREKANYCYLAIDDHSLIDITDGLVKSLTHMTADTSNTLLLVRLDPERCYVSDLSTYDKIQKILMARKLAAASEASRRYWRDLIPATAYDPTSRAMTRPELLVPYDIAPEDIITTFE